MGCLPSMMFTNYNECGHCLYGNLASIGIPREFERTYLLVSLGRWSLQSFQTVSTHKYFDTSCRYVSVNVKSDKNAYKHGIIDCQLSNIAALSRCSFSACLMLQDWFCKAADKAGVLSDSSPSMIWILGVMLISMSCDEHISHAR